MKTVNFLIFFGVFFAVYGLVNYYIYIRGWQAIPADAHWRGWYLPLFLFLSLSFIAGRFLERVWLSPVSSVLVWTGSFWLAAMLYFVLALALFDLLRLVNHFIPFFPDVIATQYERAKLLAGLGVIACVAIVLAAGAINASIPEVRKLEIRIGKPLRTDSTLHVVVASDIHLGTIIGDSRFERIAERINRLRPDLVLFAGDIVDEDLGPVVKQNLGEHLRDIKARYGVFAVTGNHEYIGGVEEACAYLGEHGVTMLRDSVAVLPNGLTLVGREDRSISQFTERKRKPLTELLQGVDRSSPTILMDHQPIRLDEAREAGIDIQLSGHTHHGQLWPFNYIAQAIYEVSWGYLHKGGTHVYVSSGVGSWGPPVRTGNRPEIVSLTLMCGQPAGNP